jgi:hypothetical protein
MFLITVFPERRHKVIMNGTFESRKFASSNYFMGYIQKGKAITL